MARKRAKSTTRSSTAPGRTLVHVLRVLITLTLCLALIAAIVWFGTQAGESVAPHERYATKFADIQCPAPPGRTREAFLSEVRYLTTAPEVLSTVKATLPEELAAWFRKHPWVASVDRIRILPDQSIHMEITFRTPILLVRVKNSTPRERLVDKNAILLPQAPIPQGITELVDEVELTAIQAGQTWEDPVVKRAASLAADFDAQMIQKLGQGWRVTQRSGRVLIVSW